MKASIISGKRKRAVAKARISPGTGKITINKLPYEYLPEFKKLAIQEVVEICRENIQFDFDVKVNVMGGGAESQIGAARLAIARALVAYTKSEKLKRAFLNYDRNMLVADVRRKEHYKPGDSKARAKRQKSYR